MRWGWLTASVWFVFTFQYVSILILIPAAVSINAVDIYIPICFYFNSENEAALKYINKFTFQYVSILILTEITENTPYFYLHSNMFLF